jgi:hypothetical protein
LILRISTTTSCIWCGYFQRIEGPAAKELVAAAPVNALVAASAAPRKPITMPIMKAHDLLGHGDQEQTKATSIALGWTICRGGWCRCVHCGKAKAKRKNIPKNTEHEKAAKPGGRIFTDITSIRKPKNDSKALFVSKPHKLMKQPISGSFGGLKRRTAWLILLVRCCISGLPKE